MRNLWSKRPGLAAAAIAGLVVPMIAPRAVGVARADHDHSFMAPDPSQEEVSQISAGVALETAEYDSGYYVGSYQGVMPQVSWARGRFGASATIGLYHLEENGLDVNGVGDAMATGHATLFAGETAQAGVAMHVMVPTGSERQGLGMGHVMLMPSTWGSWRADHLTVNAAAGYSRGLTSLDGHQHGGPLVDPMNLQELTFSAGADLAVGSGVHVGGRTLGGVALGAGRTRVIGGGRVGWGTPRVSTGVELQLGLAGDPFSVRGVVDTALRF